MREVTPSEQSATGAPPGAAPPSSALPRPAEAADREHVVWRELERTFLFYDRHAKRDQIAYRSLKVVTLLVGAAVTVLAARGAPAAVTAAFAATAVVAEGVQQLFRFHTTWIAYRATAEALRSHAFRYVAGVGEYDADAATRRQRLADAVTTLVSAEGTTWMSAMRSGSTASGTGAS